MCEVTNGCNGKCCEAVFFPFTPEELRAMGIAKKEGKERWTDEAGKDRRVMQDDVQTHEYIADMLIPIGWLPNDPATGESFNDQIKKYDQQQSLDDDNLRGFKKDENGNAIGYIVTCKNFDKENRICTDYDNRPGLCRRYGHGCAYKGCGITAQLDALKEAEDAVSRGRKLLGMKENQIL